MTQVSMTVNGTAVSEDVEDRTLLVTFLREHLGLTGTHVGCETSQCGACTVHVDGKAMKSCSMLAVMVEGADITTIEGLATSSGDKLHPVQEGFCTPGMIMSATDMIRRYGKDLNEEIIREQLEGNLCRCTGYQNIVRAIEAAAAEMTA